MIILMASLFFFTASDSVKSIPDSSYEKIMQWYDTTNDDPWETSPKETEMDR